VTMGSGSDSEDESTNRRSTHNYQVHVNNQHLWWDTKYWKDKSKRSWENLSLSVVGKEEGVRENMRLNSKLIEMKKRSRRLDSQLAPSTTSSSHW
jgi:hypothetical protein